MFIDVHDSCVEVGVLVMCGVINVSDRKSVYAGTSVCWFELYLHLFYAECIPGP